MSARRQAVGAARSRGHARPVMQASAPSALAACAAVSVHTSVTQIARSRVVWLLILAVSALLTVQVLEVFEYPGWEVTELTLVESHLRDRASRHTVVERFPLGGRRDQRDAPGTVGTDA